MNLVGETSVLESSGNDRLGSPDHHTCQTGIEVVVSSRRTLILIAALAVGAVAALLIFQYVGSIEDKAQGDAQMVSVVIAKSQIAKGSDATALITANAVGIGSRRQVELPADAVKRPEEIKGQIAQLDLQPGTIITKSMFQSDAAITNSVSTALKEGMVAVTTSSDQVMGVAGLVSQGDYVNLSIVGVCVKGGDGKYVLDGGVSQAAPAESADGAAEAGATGTATQVKCAASVYQKVRILAIGRSLGTGVAAAAPAADGSAPATTQPPVSDLITFEVPPEAAQVIQLAGPGSLYMTLVRRDYEAHPIPVSEYDKLPVAGTDGKTPYGADPEKAKS